MTDWGAVPRRKTGPKPRSDKGRACPEYIEAMSIPEPNTGCWLWLGGFGSNGYGTVRNASYQSPIGAHRFAYQVFYPCEEIDHKQVHHKCQNTACVNPSHLQALSRKDHMRAESSLGTLGYNQNKSHCKRGHEFSGPNLVTYVSPRTGKIERGCRECKKLGEKRRRAKRVSEKL